MKKTIKLLLLIGLLQVSCTTDNEIYKLENNAELTSLIDLENDSKKLTTTFWKLGITSIEKSKIDNYLLFKSTKSNNKRESKVLINGLNIEVSNNNYILENEFLFNSKDENVKITLINNEPYIITKEFSGFIKNKPDLLLIKENLTLLLFLNEITTPVSQKTDGSSIGNGDGGTDNGGSCSFWNTWYSVGVGLSESASLANFNYSHQDDINSGSTINCVQLGGVEHSSIGVVHYHTQAYCCR